MSDTTWTAEVTIISVDVDVVTFVSPKQPDIRGVVNLPMEYPPVLGQRVRVDVTWAEDPMASPERYEHKLDATPREIS